MADTRKDRILLKVTKALLKFRAESGVREAMGILGKEIGLDGAFVLRTCDIPLLYELKYLWEPKKNIAGKRLLLDVSDAPDRELFDPYGDDDSGKVLVINDTENSSLGPISSKFADSLGIRSAVVCVMKAEKDFMGFAVYVNVEPREWTEAEVLILREAAYYLGTELNCIRLDETRNELLDDYDKQTREANESKNQFVANLSHEIRTPINAVVGMISIMRHNAESPEIIGECLERMEKSTKMLMDVVNDCVDITLINERTFEIKNNWLPLATLVNSVTQVVSPLAKARNQHVSFEYDEALSVFCDEVKLGRALIASITNSCQKAENDTSISLTIQNEKIGGKDMVSFRIRDEVTGIDSEAAKHIFEAFGGARFHDSFKGTGLGMVVTKHIVEMMNGTIDFFSDGWGTELVFALPLQTRGGKREEPHSVEPKAEDRHDEYAEMYIGRRILIAEDNVLMGEILATILGYRGLEADIAFNGQEAYDRFVNNSPFYYDMILMDIQMPVMDGIEAARAVRSSGRADAGMIPIVALSANTFEDDVKNALEAGMNAYMSKPVSDKELFETISNLIL